LQDVANEVNVNRNLNRVIKLYKTAINVMLDSHVPSIKSKLFRNKISVRFEVKASCNHWVVIILKAAMTRAPNILVTVWITPHEIQK
jgi:hypothetical protein